MNIRVRSFARIRELIGAEVQTIDVPQGVTIETVWHTLSERVPALVPLRRSLRFARNGSIVSPEVQLKDGDEVCVLPPSSGG
ncbi:MAG: MoaD/ThiS family protein [Candidatus Eremiobacteraeota bacterium]|nr:MoaD/ThiS family protein [Candidatus Eremiobacteraeota bacterium]